METQEMTKMVRRNTNDLASRDLAGIVLSGAMLYPSAETVATIKLSPKLAESDRIKAEKAARREASRMAMKAAAERRAEKARLRKEAAAISRARRIQEVSID